VSNRGIVGVPRVPSGMLDRSTLRDRLGGAPLTVIRAPGGSGKTVLMAQWASLQVATGAWVTVEPDSSRLTFWTSVVESIAQPGQALHPPSEDGPDSDVLRATLLRAFRSVDVPVVLVVDDAHELRDPLVAEDLLVLLRACSNLTALVGTRVRTELEAPREALTLDVTVIEPDQLILTGDDIARIVGESGSRFGTTDKLLQASGGNPLLLRAILAGTTAGVGTGSSPEAVIADYLRGIFRQQEDLELFASTTSVPDDLDADFAQRLSGLPDQIVVSLLHSLESDGLVMRREAAGVARYRYHPLVREVLREGLRRDHLERFRSASLLASADSELRKKYLPALRHAVEAQDYLRASDVCLHGGFALLRARGAAAILHTIPLRHIARQPFLAVVLGLAANARGDRLRALELLALAYGASRAQRRSQRAAEQAGLALIETVVLRITGRAGDSVAPARRMMTILESASPAELEEIADQLNSYWYHAALSLFRAGRLEEALACGERVGISAAALADGTPESFGAAALVAVINAARGECRAAAEVLARLDAADYPIELRNGYVGSLGHVARGIVALESGDIATARAQLHAFGVRPNLEHGPLFTAFRAFLEFWDAAPEVGLRTLDHREAVDRPRARMTAQDRQISAIVRALLHAALGQVGPAHVALRELERRDPVSVLLHATLLILEQRPEDAIERLNVSTDWNGPRLQAAAEILRACAWLMREDEDLAAAALTRFLAVYAVHGTRTPLLLVPAELREPLWTFADRLGVGPLALADLREVPSPLRIGLARAALTRREADVLEQLRSTASFSEIAANLSVSPNTVKSQVRTLYRKFEVSNRDEALRVAYLQGLFDR
jgi:LuxR family maltose regulon positive regulatory protein